METICLGVVLVFVVIIILGPLFIILKKNNLESNKTKVKIGKFEYENEMEFREVNSKK